MPLNNQLQSHVINEGMGENVRWPRREIQVRPALNYGASSSELVSRYRYVQGEQGYVCPPSAKS